MKPFILEVTLEPRPDGGLRAYCDKVPGFILSHSDPDAVIADVAPALEGILSAMYDKRVRVQLAKQYGDSDEVKMPAHLCRSMQLVGLSNNH
jgi:hypothetical protein